MALPPHKRTFSAIAEDHSFNQHTSKKTKYSASKPEVMAMRPPSLSPLSTTNSTSPPNTNSNSNSNSNTNTSSSSSNSHIHTPTGNTSNNNNNNHNSSSHQPQRKKAKRRDLFDSGLDETYANTRATSTIPAPTLGNEKLEKVWREKTERALLSFQRHKISDSIIKEPNNPIMKLLLKESKLETDEQTIIKLQDTVLSLVYSSQSQQQKLYQPKNRRRRYNRYNNNNNNDQNRMHRYDKSWYEKLPGPQPHSITRQNLERLRSYYYWVTEKSDGIRFMLFLSNNHPYFEAYVVGRKFEFYRISHPFYKCFLNNVSGPSLLDGELIINQNNLLEYLAFDCVAMGGKSFSNEPTSHRVEQVKNFINKYKRDLIEFPKIEQEKQKKYVEPPIKLVAKKHWKAGDISRLLDKINHYDEENEYYFENEERKTKNDGLIFTPQENNFLMSYDPGALVKWKFLEKNTIDLKVKSPYIFRGKLDLWAGGKGQSSVLFAQVDMNKKENRLQFEMLHDEMKRLSKCRNGFVDSFIVECAWNFKTFEWDLLQNRPDKHIPNFITVCTDTLRVMMDNVTEHELIEACSINVNNSNNNMGGGHGGHGGGGDYYNSGNNNNNNSYSSSGGGGNYSNYSNNGGY